MPDGSKQAISMLQGCIAAVAHRSTQHGPDYLRQQWLALYKIGHATMTKGQETWHTTNEADELALFHGSLNGWRLERRTYRP